MYKYFVIFDDHTIEVFSQTNVTSNNTEMINITTEISNYINTQNQNIWDEIKDEYIFSLIYNPFETSWMSNSENGNATIYTNTKNIDYSSFTHELLHIYLDFKGMSGMPELIYSIMGQNSFKILLEQDLVPFLHNVCSHKKMFPYYEEMGFSEHNFVQERITFGNNDLNFIKSSFENSGSKLIAVNQFIGHTISLFNNVIVEDEPKCSSYLQKLKNIQPELFDIIQKFDNNWNNSIDLNLTPVFLNFENDLENWLTKNELKSENNYCC